MRVFCALKLSHFSHAMSKIFIGHTHMQAVAKLCVERQIKSVKTAFINKTQLQSSNLRVNTWFIFRGKQRFSFLTLTPNKL